MSKPVKRVCPACGEEKEFRADQKTCGCKVNQEKHEETTTELYLRKENQRLKNELDNIREQQGFETVVTEKIMDAVEALNPLPLVPYTNGKHAEAKITAVVKFSDWHIGAKIREEETEGFGSFNWDKAQYRVDYITEKIVGWVDTHRKSFKIDELVILGEGDWVSGDIHEELRRTNEFPLPVQAVKAGELLARSVARFAPHFGEIHLIEVGADNHGRLQPKPQFKQKSFNNMSYVTYAIANSLLRDHKNVNVVLAEGIKQLVDVAGVKILSEHGDVVKAWMGIPYYGMERLRGKEASRRMAAMLERERQRGREEFEKIKRDIGFDYMSVGHWHVPGVVSGNILTNGSLTGTDEFDHGSGRHAAPSQVSFLMHPKYKLFDWTPWTPKK